MSLPFFWAEGAYMITGYNGSAWYRLRICLRTPRATVKRRRSHGK